MAALDALEKRLDDVFVKNAPVQLPENAKKTIVQYLPWVNLVLGILSLWVAWALWRWVQWVNEGLGAVNSYLRVYGAQTYDVSPLVYVGLAITAVIGVLYIMAFMSTKDRKKSGWNLMFYALLLQALYGLVMVFTDYGGIGNLISMAIGVVIGLYFLFQIRGQYTGTAARVVKTPTPETH